MKKKMGSSKTAADKLVKNIRCKTRHTYSAEEKIRIVWQVFGVKKVFQLYVDVRASLKACITNGRRGVS
jgi:hypothetical protein